jgi:hypothetical protein
METLMGPQNTELSEAAGIWRVPIGLWRGFCFCETEESGQSSGIIYFRGLGYRAPTRLDPENLAQPSVQTR